MNIGQMSQTILVLQQNGKGENKIRGIRSIGKDRFVIQVVNIDASLPTFIDDTDAFLPRHINAELVMDYLKHPDLTLDLAERCKELQIPEIAVRKKIKNRWTHTPPICCALARHDNLGEYGRLFGAPTFEARISGDVIMDIEVLRGAPCGATWAAAPRIIGLAVDEALRRIGLETQYACTADPSDWDPFYGKSPVHLAAELHTQALLKAIGQGR